jgi:hypothetical protein
LLGGQAVKQNELTEREKFNLGAALDKASHELSQADPRIVCLNSAVTYNREQESFILPYLNRKYFVHHRTGEVKALLDGRGVSIHLQILFLHYLCHASGTPVQGEWITFKEFPGGQIYLEPYQKRTIKPLLKYFGQKTEQFVKIASSLDGKTASFGDVSVILRPFPRVPIGFVLWKGDEEFPPSANILYDASAPQYLPTEDYALLPGLIIWEMAALLT